jgi:CRP-like cAMP-binding protein
MYSGWEKARQFSKYKSIPISTALFQQGTIAQSAILIEIGWVKLVREEQRGPTQIIALYPPGSLLGAETLIFNQPYSATAIALIGCQIYSIPKAIFLNWIKTDLKFSWQFHRAHSQRTQARDISSAQSRCLPPRLRLEQLLWRLFSVQNQYHNGERSKEEHRLLIPLQRQELAQMICVTREHLSRVLKEMEKDQVIRRDNGWLIVQNPNELWRAPEIQMLVGDKSSQSSELDLPDIIVT